MDAEFLGSSNTLIPSKYIRNMSADKPQHISEGVNIYEQPKENHNYIAVCDPSRGTGNDSHAFIVFDVTEYPIQIVATFQDNEISPLILPSILDKVGRTYNDASVLVEVNDNGQQVADILWSDYEYENTVMLSKKAAKDSKNTPNTPGVRTTKNVKRLGCSLFKDMVEAQKILINDMELISEISTFIQKRASYEAEVGCHDDLVMCCILLSWFASTKDFEYITDTNFKAEIIKKNMKAVEDDLLPFGFIDNGINNDIWEETESFFYDRFF